MTNFNEEIGSKTSAERLQGTKHYDRRQVWKYVDWIILFLVIAFCFSKIVSAEITSHTITRQEAIRRSQIANGIPQIYNYLTYK